MCYIHDSHIFEKLIVYNLTVLCSILGLVEKCFLFLHVAFHLTKEYCCMFFYPKHPFVCFSLCSTFADLIFCPHFSWKLKQELAKIKGEKSDAFSA